jgi:hypothetical protein
MTVPSHTEAYSAFQGSLDPEMQIIRLIGATGCTRAEAQDALRSIDTALAEDDGPQGADRRRRAVRQQLQRVYDLCVAEGRYRDGITALKQLTDLDAAKEPEYNGVSAAVWVLPTPERVAEARRLISGTQPKDD